LIVIDNSKTPGSGNVRYRTEESGRAEATRSHRRRRGKQRKLDAARLIKLLRKHGTLTLVVCVVFVSVLTGYIAIELGA
jgi:hypothetical protein